MNVRIFDWLLLIVVVIGGLQVWQSGRERSRLSATHAGLVRVTGDLQIGDATNVYVQALRTDVPLEFAWRVYFPPNYNAMLSQRPIGGATEVTSDPSECIARVRLRQDDSGVLRLYSHFGSGSQLMEFEDNALAELLRGRWHELRVEQLGAAGVAVLKSDQRAVLLRLTLPEDLHRAAREKLSAEDQARCVPVLYELELSPASSGP